MKQLYTIGILILLGVISWGALFHGDYVMPAPDRALKKTPTKADITRPLKRDDKPLPLEPIWERNLFAAYRGDSELSNTPQLPAKPKKRAVMELIGVCKFGSFAGATILDKTPVKRVSGQPAKKSGAVFYRLGDTLSSGYVLKDVSRNTATLARGSSELILELDFGGAGSAKRNSAEVKNQNQVVANEAKRLAGEDTKAPKAEEKPKEKAKENPLVKNPPEPSFNRGKLKSISDKQVQLLLQLHRKGFLSRSGRKQEKEKDKKKNDK